MRELSSSAFEVDDELRLERLLLAGQMQRRLDARREIAEERLRHMHKNAHPMEVGDLEQGPPRRAAGVDEIADIDVACRDDAVERRLDLLEAGQLLEPVDRGLLGHHIGLGDRQRGGPRRRRQAIGVALFLGRPPLATSCDVRSSVTWPRSAFACACSTAACNWTSCAFASSSCWSRSGAEIVASTSPFVTCAPISLFQAVT